MSPEQTRPLARIQAVAETAWETDSDENWSLALLPGPPQIDPSPNPRRLLAGTCHCDFHRRRVTARDSGVHSWGDALRPGGRHVGSPADSPTGRRSLWSPSTQVRTTQTRRKGQERRSHLKSPQAPLQTRPVTREHAAR